MQPVRRISASEMQRRYAEEMGEAALERQGRFYPCCGRTTVSGHSPLCVYRSNPQIAPKSVIGKPEKRKEVRAQFLGERRAN